MIKRYYQGLVSLKYVYFMFGLPVIIFILAYIDAQKHISAIRYVMAVVSCILIIVMYFYFRDRIRVAKALKQIEDIDEYENGAIIDHSRIMEERILCFNKLEIHEVFLATLESITMDTDKLVLHIKCADQSVDMSVRSIEEGERFCAFIKRKYPEVSFENIRPKGKGTFKDLEE